MPPKAQCPFCTKQYPIGRALSRHISWAHPWTRATPVNQRGPPAAPAPVLPSLAGFVPSTSRSAPKPPPRTARAQQQAGDEPQGAAEAGPGPRTAAARAAAAAVGAQDEHGTAVANAKLKRKSEGGGRGPKGMKKARLGSDGVLIGKAVANESQQLYGSAKKVVASVNPFFHMHDDVFNYRPSPTHKDELQLVTEYEIAPAPGSDDTPTVVRIPSGDDLDSLDDYLDEYRLVPDSDDEDAADDETAKLTAQFYKFVGLRDRFEKVFTCVPPPTNTRLLVREVREALGRHCGTFRGEFVKKAKEYKSLIFEGYTFLGNSKRTRTFLMDGLLSYPPTGKPDELSEQGKVMFDGAVFRFLKLVLFMRQNFYKSPTSYKSLGRANATLGGIKEITVEMLAAAIVALHCSLNEPTWPKPGTAKFNNGGVVVPDGKALDFEEGRYGLYFNGLVSVYQDKFGPGKAGHSRLAELNAKLFPPEGGRGGRNASGYSDDEFDDGGLGAQLEAMYG